VEINTTFAEVVGSKLIKNQAIESLALSSEQRQDLSVNGRIIGGTNILEVTAKGKDPIVVRDFTNAIGARTVEYVGSLYDVFELEPLDEASIPRTPVSPKPVLNLSLGAVFGLALGVGLAFLLEYLGTPHYEKDSFNIVDRETGAYNKSYLMHRLWQEMSRSKRNKYPLALGMIKVEIGNTDDKDAEYKQIEALRLVKLLAEKMLRAEDVLARFDEDTLAVLLPDMSEKRARFFMEELNPKIESVTHDIGGQDEELLLRSTVSAVSYENYRLKQEKFMEQAVQVVEEAMHATNGKEKLW
jgi:diguanylate cyclase (GGDEF)-like protein